MGQQFTTGRNSAHYVTRELVIYASHHSEVLRALDFAGAAPIVLDRSADLGLIRVTVADIQNAAARLAAAAGERGARVPAPTGPDDLDPLLAALRGYVQEHHSGWTPEVGKNRFLSPVFRGGGAINHGGGGDPRVVHGGLPPRLSGPGQGVRVGVLDTRIWPKQQWLAGGWTADPPDLLADRPEPYAVADGHATFVAGLVLTQAPSAQVHVEHVLPDGGVGADAWTLATAMVGLGRSGIDLLNISLLCHTEDGAAPMLLETAMRRLPDSVVVIAAAGNNGANPAAGSGEEGDGEEGDGEVEPTAPAYPAALPDVVAVGSSTVDGRLAAFTPRDAGWVNVVALGQDVLSTYLDGDVLLDGRPQRFYGWARWTGTSFSAALVTGAVAARIRTGVNARAALAGLVAAGVPIPATADWAPRRVPLADPYGDLPLGPAQAVGY